MSRESERAPRCGVGCMPKMGKFVVWATARSRVSIVKMPSASPTAARNLPLKKPVLVGTSHRRPFRPRRKHPTGDALANPETNQSRLLVATRCQRLRGGLRASQSRGSASASRPSNMRTQSTRTGRADRTNHELVAVTPGTPRLKQASACLKQA